MIALQHTQFFDCVKEQKVKISRLLWLQWRQLTQMFGKFWGRHLKTSYKLSNAYLSLENFISEKPGRKFDDFDYSDGTDRNQI